MQRTYGTRHAMVGLFLLGSGALAAIGSPIVHADAAHPPIIPWCAADPAPCIAISEAPVAAANTITVSGYVRNAAPQPLRLVITDPRFGTTVYGAVVLSTPMVGDYAGYSQFRFIVPAQPGGGVTISGRDEYLPVQVFALAPTKGKGYIVVGTSAVDQVWSPGSSL